MSGATRSENSSDWEWAHIMWQRHGIRIEEWGEMERNQKDAYIASEQLEIENPMNGINRIVMGLFTKKK